MGAGEFRILLSPETDIILEFFFKLDLIVYDSAVREWNLCVGLFQFVSALNVSKARRMDCFSFCHRPLGM